MGQARGRGAKRPRGGIAELPGPGRGTCSASPKISRASEAEDLREEVDRGTTIGGRSDLQEEIRDAGEPESCLGITFPKSAPAPEWKAQQKILWAEVLKESGKWKSRWRIWDLLADERCSQAVLDVLSATDVGRRAGVRGRGAGCRGGTAAVATHAFFHGIRR